MKTRDIAMIPSGDKTLLTRPILDLAFGQFKTHIGSSHDDFRVKDYLSNLESSVSLPDYTA
jgi:hypothetical protein